MMLMLAAGCCHPATYLGIHVVALGWLLLLCLLLLHLLLLFLLLLLLLLLRCILLLLSPNTWTVLTAA
jgi:hypothetical protein